MIDWMCQLKLSILIGIIAALTTHTVMDHIVQLSFTWWFDLAIFTGTTLAFFIGMRLRLIECSTCRHRYCDQCPASKIK
jgi:ABC-type dipeptide/oligopeptide/nickel transport system permease component